MDVCHVILMDFVVINRAFLVAHPLVMSVVLVMLVHVVEVYQVTNDVEKHQGWSDCPVSADEKLSTGLHAVLVR